MRKRDETPTDRGKRVTRETAPVPLMDDSSDSGEVGGPPARQVTPQERHARIAEIAYRNAEKRGFTPGGELDDWLQAEREVDSEESAPGVI
jgi:Protein of unknown function (DUF2934)